MIMAEVRIENCQVHVLEQKYVSGQRSWSPSFVFAPFESVFGTKIDIVRQLLTLLFNKAAVASMTTGQQTVAALARPLSDLISLAWAGARPAF